MLPGLRTTLHLFMMLAGSRGHVDSVYPRGEQFVHTTRGLDLITRRWFWHLCAKVAIELRRLSAADPSGMVRRRANPPAPMTPHLTLVPIICSPSHEWMFARATSRSREFIPARFAGC